MYSAAKTVVIFQKTLTMGHLDEGKTPMKENGGLREGDICSKEAYFRGLAVQEVIMGNYYIRQSAS